MLLQIASLYPRFSNRRITNILCILGIVFIFDLVNIMLKQSISIFRWSVFNIDLISSRHELVNQVFLILTKLRENSFELKKLNINIIYNLFKFKLRVSFLNSFGKTRNCRWLSIFVRTINHLYQNVTNGLINVHECAILSQNL